MGQDAVVIRALWLKFAERRRLESGARLGARLRKVGLEFCFFSGRTVTRTSSPGFTVLAFHPARTRYEGAVISTVTE